MDHPPLPAIPLVDARADPLVLADPAAVRALRDAVFGPFRTALLPALPIADRIARRWLARSASPYLAELEVVAKRTGVAGLYAINISYEYGCTTLARVDAPGRGPSLYRTLDWPFLGLGRAAIVARRAGSAGEFYDATWPGAVGTLTAMAPGRFAAAINQAPLFRRTRTNMLRPVDYLRNLSRTLLRERGMPPLHLLRHACETAPDFPRALEMLARIELARPALFTLVGCAPDEIAIIERRERDAVVHRGAGSVANDWRVADHAWEARPCYLADRRLDSIVRRQAIEQAVPHDAEPFAWVAPPVRNWNTRLAVAMNPREGSMKVLGYEPCNDVDAGPATTPFSLHASQLATAVPPCPSAVS